MICVRHSWFVLANIRTYSAMVADMVPAHEAPFIDGIRVAPHSKPKFWNGLASHNPRLLRRHGWPVSIAVRAEEDFPGGSVVYHVAAGTFQLIMDADLANPIYQREVAGPFGLDLTCASFQLTGQRLGRPVAPPKPCH